MFETWWNFKYQEQMTLHKHLTKNFCATDENMRHSLKTELSVEEGMCVGLIAEHKVESMCGGE